MSRLTAFFDRLMQRYTPDPFVFAVLLTIAVYLMGVSLTNTRPQEMLIYWGEGFWNLTTFTLQMVMVLLGGYLIASSVPVQALLSHVARPIHTNGQAVVVITLVSAIASWLNWGLGLISGAFLAVELAKSVKQANFRLYVASAYSGFLVWHAGLSGSIPLLVNTDGNFSQQWLSSRVPVTETIFSLFNLSALAILLITLPLMNWLLAQQNRPSVELETEESIPKNAVTPQTPAEFLETSNWLGTITACFGLAYIILEVMSSNFTLDLNRINFIFLFTALLLHRNVRSFIDATLNGAKKVGPLLIQYPFYAGIMYMMTQSGLADMISQAFVEISTPRTFPVWTFFSAGLVNFFVPSGGGQWAVQAPIVLPAAQQMGLDLTKPIMAVAWGDAWTNLAQPFWALPILAIAGLKARDIMGYCLSTLLVSGVILSLLLLIL